MLITRRELIQQKLGDAFVGREQALSALMDTLDNPASCGFVNVWGISGMGKSALLAKFAAKAREKGLVCCEVDLAFCRSIISLLSKISTGLTSPFLDEAGNACLKVRQRYLDIHRRLVDKARLSNAAISQISRLSEFDSELIEQNIGRREALDLNSIAAVQSELNDDYEFFRDPTSEYARALAFDINSFASTRPAGSAILIILDRSEAVPESMLSWIRQHLFEELAANVVLIIAGQRPLEEGWEGVLQLGRAIELKEMTQSEIAALSARFGITDPDAVNWIFEASNGLPLFAESLCRDYNKNPKIVATSPAKVTPPDAIVSRYLNAVTPEIRELTQKAALLRCVTSESISGILDADQARHLMSIIKTLPYTQEGPKGYLIHDRVRGYLEQHYQKHNAAGYSEIHAAAAAHYHNRGQRGIEVFESLTEEVYHLIRFDPRSGVEFLKQEFSYFSALNRHHECETLITTATQAGIDFPDWMSFFKAVVKYQRSMYIDCLESLQDMLDRSEVLTDTELNVQVLMHCALSMWYLCDFQRSLDYARMAINVVKLHEDSDLRASSRLSFHYNRSVGIQALNQDRLGRFEEGIASALEMRDASRRVNDIRNLGYALNSAGYFSWHLGHWLNADSYLSQSLEAWEKIQSSFGKCYPLSHRSLLRTFIGDPDFGIVSLERCAALARDTANQEMVCKTLHNLAEGLWGLGRYAESIDVASEAVARARDLGQRYFEADSLRVKAMACLVSGKQLEGQGALKESFSLSTGISALYICCRLEAIAYGANLHDKLNLPNLDARQWTAATIGRSFGRAVLDLGRFALRTGAIDLLKGDGSDILELLLGGAMAMNLNAYLLLEQEIIHRGMTIPFLGSIINLASELSAPPKSAPVPIDGTVVRSANRAVRHEANAAAWDHVLGRAAEL